MARWREAEHEPEGRKARPGSELGGHLSTGEQLEQLDRTTLTRKRKPKDGKTWKQRIGRWFAGSAVTGVILMALHYFFGPKADVPAVDPVEKINRLAQGLPTNAAPLYFRAAEVYDKTDPIDGDELNQLDEPAVYARVAGHVERNAACLRRLAAAIEPTDCLFSAEHSQRGLIEVPNGMVLRDLTKLLRDRLALACHDHDWEVFQQTLSTLERMGRHMTAQSMPIPYLYGFAALSTVQGALLEPLAWPELTDDDRAAYHEQIVACCSPPPDLTELLRFSRDELCWGARNNFGARRVVGEIDRYIAPLVRLADLPIEDQTQADHPTRVEMLKLWERSPSGRNMMGKRAHSCIGLLRSLLWALDFRIALVVMQRGNLTAAKIHEYHRREGHWPPNLDSFCPLAIDIYTGQPLVYETTGDSFRLYSCGRDGDDDGGKHSSLVSKLEQSEAGEAEQPTVPDGDFVFWPVPEDYDE